MTKKINRRTTKNPNKKTDADTERAERRKKHEKMATPYSYSASRLTFGSSIYR